MSTRLTYTDICMPQGSGIFHLCYQQGVSLTLLSFSLYLCSVFLPGFSLLSHWSKKLYTLTNKRNCLHLWIKLQNVGVLKSSTIAWNGIYLIGDEIPNKDRDLQSSVCTGSWEPNPAGKGAMHVFYLYI